MQLQKTFITALKRVYAWVEILAIKMGLVVKDMKVIYVEIAVQTFQKLVNLSAVCVQIKLETLYR
jgi:hypothetical protein